MNLWRALPTALTLCKSDNPSVGVAVRQSDTWWRVRTPCDSWIHPHPAARPIWTRKTTSSSSRSRRRWSLKYRPIFHAADSFTLDLIVAPVRSALNRSSRHKNGFGSMTPCPRKICWNAYITQILEDCIRNPRVFVLVRFHWPLVKYYGRYSTKQVGTYYYAT